MKLITLDSADENRDEEGFLKMDIVRSEIERLIKKFEYQNILKGVSKEVIKEIDRNEEVLLEGHLIQKGRIKLRTLLRREMKLWRKLAEKVIDEVIEKAMEIVKIKEKTDYRKQQNKEKS